MADSPSQGVADGFRDGGGPSSRVAVSTADALRNIADWLEAHPSAVASQIDLWPSTIAGQPVIVHDYSAGSLDEVAEHARLIGGKWKADLDELATTWTQTILPGVEFQIFLSHAKAAAAA